MHAHDRFLPDWFNRVRARADLLSRAAVQVCNGQPLDLGHVFGG